MAKPVEEIRVGDTVFLTTEDYGMVVSSYGLNEKGWFMCVSPATVYFAPLDTIRGWADPKTHVIHEVDISAIPKPPEEAVEDF
jgi:hypothetical protein